MGIFAYALRDNERCPSWYESDIAPVRCRKHENHDGPHEFSSNSLYYVWTNDDLLAKEEEM